MRSVKGAVARWVGLAFAWVGLALVILIAGASSARADKVVVGSKNFSESRLLAEMFAQLIESRTSLQVERRFNLAGTAICFGALESGDIDLYPEYTGTGFVTLLNLPVASGPDALSPAQVLAVVRREFRARHDMEWLGPLGFENAYEVAVTRAVAERFKLVTIGDLANVDARLRFAFGYEFMEREDGLVGLRRVYGLQPQDLTGMQQSLKYQAAGDGRIDVLDVYTTDGLILVHDLVILQDDRGVFPPYAAAPLVRGATLREYPELAVALGELTSVLDESGMRELNRQAEVDQVPIETVAATFLANLSGENAVHEIPTDSDRDLSFFAYLWAQRGDLLGQTGTHLLLVAIALVLGVLVALPLGLFLHRRASSAETVIRGVGVLQTIPSIALLAFMIPALGVGAKPAVAALFLYSLFPILRNTYTGVSGADPNAVESARALGMTSGQVMRSVRLPLAAPIIMAGLRTAAVISVGTATLAAFIGAGGLGQPIVSGLQLNDTRIVLSGAIPAALLALAVDALLGGLERRLRPKGLAGSK